MARYDALATATLPQREDGGEGGEEDEAERRSGSLGARILDGAEPTPAGAAAGKATDVGPASHLARETLGPGRAVTGSVALEHADIALADVRATV